MCNSCDCKCVKAKSDDLDLSKPFQLRSGQKARLVCSDINNAKPLGFVVDSSYTSEGKISNLYMGGPPEVLISRPRHGRLDTAQKSPYDVINVPDRPVVTTEYQYVSNNSVAKIRFKRPSPPYKSQTTDVGYNTYTLVDDEITEVFYTPFK